MTKTIFEMDGTVYTRTEKGYYYKSTGSKDKKGNDVMMRIGRAVFEQAFEEYVNRVDEADEEQDEFDAAYEERQEMAREEEERQKDSDRQAEAEVNKKQAEKKPIAKKGMTFEQLIELAKKHYNEGGDGIVECWDQNTYDEYVRQFGPITKKVANQLIGIKPKRSRKNVFHTSIEVPDVTLTEKQVNFMLHLPDTTFWEHGLDSTLWVDVLVDEIGGEFEEKPMTVGAMISTLREKGLMVVAIGNVNGRKAKYIELTEDGKKVAKELGLE